MKKKLLPAALIAVAGISLPPGHADAVEPNVPVSSGDLVLGFQLSGDNDLEVNLGPISNFLAYTSVTQISFGVIPADQTNAGATVSSLNADLSATYTSGWATNSQLYWGVVGASGNTVFLTVDSNNPDPQRPSLNGANLTSGDINTSLINSLSETPSTSQSTETASIQTTAANSWDSFTPLTQGFDTNFGFEQAIGVDSATSSVLNLWELAPNGRNGGGEGTDIGSFSLNSSGNLTFTPASVPEPSTWVSLVGAGALLGSLRLVPRKRTA